MRFSAGCFFDADFNENIRLVAQYGFGAIERLSWRDLDLEKTRDVLRKNNVTLSAILLDSEDEKAREAVGWKHGIVHEDAEEPFIRAFRETLHAAVTLETKNIVVITGAERDDVSREIQKNNCISALRAVADEALEARVTIVIEPLNRLIDHPNYFLNTSADAFDIIRAVDSPAVRVLFDIYHQQITEGNLIRNIRENIDFIGHFHIADNPGRNEPGTGEINYPRVFEAIKNSGYNGYLAFECGSTVSPESLAKSMRELTLPYEG